MASESEEFERGGKRGWDGRGCSEGRKVVNQVVRETQARWQYGLVL